MQTSKWMFASKTVWMNIVMGIVAFYPPAHDLIAAHPEWWSVAWTVVAMALRLITKKEVTLLP